MKIVVSFKVVPDDQDIQVSGDGSLDYAKAHQIVSTYDLNAMEAAAQLAAANEGSEVVGITVGGKKIDDSKTKKNVLARGIDRALHDRRRRVRRPRRRRYRRGSRRARCQGGRISTSSSAATALPTTTLSRLTCSWPLSSGLPVVNGATKIEAGDGVVTVDRTLEDVVETVEVPLPAVVSVAPDVALPRIPGMKDILAAGKKPMNVVRR